jgi:precorrin-3B methylase
LNSARIAHALALVLRTMCLVQVARGPGVAYEGVQLVANARQRDVNGTSRRSCLACIADYRRRKVGKHTRHRLKVADKAVDDAEECEDGGLVGGGDANMPGIARQFLCA